MYYSSMVCAPDSCTARLSAFCDALSCSSFWKPARSSHNIVPSFPLLPIGEELPNNTPNSLSAPNSRTEYSKLCEDVVKLDGKFFPWLGTSRMQHCVLRSTCQRLHQVHFWILHTVDTCSMPGSALHLKEYISPACAASSFECHFSRNQQRYSSESWRRRLRQHLI